MQRNIHGKKYSCKGRFMVKKELILESIGQGGFA